ncbi:hypothetical protein B7C51_15690 [Paenibacillus larvae subsp. pulvifaciens]|uniref:Bro-N domain-containing protein n=1 Tax=Paenibacillus larvae subsp. pulvifaciens TaxID=1477 RepID=A0A1V0UV49_9BACL|nr:hypothetical protein B7C51_15690 [Paenibacillus larvae subsp. pulvifaciens]
MRETKFRFLRWSFRSFEENGEIWIVAEDAADILGYWNASSMVSKLEPWCSYFPDMCPTRIINLEGQEVGLISEWAFYQAICDIGGPPHPEDCMLPSMTSNVEIPQGYPNTGATP